MEIHYSQPTVLDLFKVSYQYQIPAFQRPYAWKPDNIDDFWADISAMDGGQHFLGPMVLHETSSDAREVIDGQQRLITLQMLIALIRDRYVEMGDEPRDPNVSADPLSKAPDALIRDSIFTNRYFLRAGEHNRRVLDDFILRTPNDPQRRSLDQKKDIDTLKKVPRARNKPLIDAHLRLRGHLTKHLEKSSDSLGALRSLEEALVRRVTLVVLDLKSLDDAFLLFETLNDRGLRLSAADLLKSHLLSRFDITHHGDTDSLDKASDVWDAMVDQLGGGDISGYLRHNLLMRHERVKKSDVFPFFKKDVKQLGPDKTLKELSSMGGHYAEFLRPPEDDPPLYEVLSNLRGTSVDTHRIALMPARAYLTKSRFAQFARVAEVLSFRWTVVGGNAQVLESIYQEAASTIYSSEGGEIEAAEELLKSRIPADGRFREDFVGQALGYTNVAAYALRKIELAIEPGEKTIKPSQQVNVEHIMPKASTPFWEARETSEAAYEVVVQQWGNLTLLLKPLNESIGNGDWNTKRFGRPAKEGKPALPGYFASDIRLTKDLLELDDWSSDLIELRARWLAAAAPRIWTLQPDVTGFPSFLEVVADPRLIDVSESDTASTLQATDG